LELKFILSTKIHILTREKVLIVGANPSRLVALDFLK